MQLHRVLLMECIGMELMAFAELEDLPLGQKKKNVGDAVPFGRMGKPSDLIGMAVFLATSEADYIVAQTFGVDGGNWMS